MKRTTKRVWALTGLMVVVVSATASSCKEPGDYDYSLSLDGGTSWAADTTQAIPFTVSGGGVPEMSSCVLDFLVSQGGQSTAVQQLGGGSLGGGDRTRSGSVALRGGALPPGTYTVRSICSFTKSGNLPKTAENTVGVTLLNPTPSPSPSPSASTSASSSTPTTPAPGSSAPSTPGGGPSAPSSSTDAPSAPSSPSSPAAPSAPSDPSAPPSPI